MDLNDLSKIVSDQDKGHEFELRDPVHGDPVGMKITMAGPDGAIARKARDELAQAIDKLTSRRPEAREALMIDYLFAVTLGWDVREAGQSLPFNRQNFDRLIGAGLWVRAQLDLFAGDRSPYFADPRVKR